jgi:hypothetical protein
MVGRGETLWYYRKRVEALSKTDRSELVEELYRVVSNIERLSK